MAQQGLYIRDSKSRQRQREAKPTEERQDAQPDVPGMGTKGTTKDTGIGAGGTAPKQSRAHYAQWA